MKRGVISMSSSPSKHVLVAPTSNRTMRLPIKLQGLKQTVDTTALINSGATGNFLDPRLLPKGTFKLTRVANPITAYNIDGTPNNKGTIKWITTASFSTGTFHDTIRFMIVHLSRPQIILSMPWLQKWNPKINWKTFSLKLGNTDDLSPNIDFEIATLVSRSNPQGVERTLREHPPSNGSIEEQIDKLTISMEIAQAEQPKEVLIPEFCKDFADVFSEKTYEQLPPQIGRAHV